LEVKGDFRYLVNGKCVKVKEDKKK